MMKNARCLRKWGASGCFRDQEDRHISKEDKVSPGKEPDTTQIQQITNFWDFQL